MLNISENLIIQAFDYDDQDVEIFKTLIKQNPKNLHRIRQYLHSYIEDTLLLNDALIELDQLIFEAWDNNVGLKIVSD